MTEQCFLTVYIQLYRLTITSAFCSYLALMCIVSTSQSEFYDCRLFRHFMTFYRQLREAHTPEGLLLLLGGRFCPPRRHDAPIWMKFGLEKSTFSRLIHAKSHFTPSVLGGIWDRKNKNAKISEYKRPTGATGVSLGRFLNQIFPVCGHVHGRSSVQILGGVA